MKWRLADAIRGWFRRTSLPHSRHIGVDLAAERRSDFTVEATYRLDGHKPVELLSLKVVCPDDMDTAISLKDEQ